MRNGKKILTMVASAALAVSTFGGCGAGAGGGQDGADGQVFCDWAQLQPPVVV